MGERGEAVAGAQAQVAIEGLDRLGRPEGDPLAAALAHDPHDAGVEVEVVLFGHLRRPAQVGDLAQAGTGGQEDAHQGRVAADLGATNSVTPPVEEAS
jgi:hypothetical protein